MKTTIKSNVEDIYPLSPMQQGMLFHTLYDAQSGSYFEQMKYVMHGEFDESAFKRAWQSIVEQHAILRTHFVWDDVEKPLQVVRDRIELPWIVCDWCDLPEPQQQERVQEFLEKDRRRGFRLGRTPLFRVAIIKLAPTEVLFVWSFHHALLDGWSVALLLQELFAYYEAYCRNEPYKVTSPRPYRDYIAWLQEQDQEQAKHFWQAALAGFTTPTMLEVDQGAGKKHTSAIEYAQEHITLSQEMTTHLQTFARQHQLTLNTLIQGVWALLLSHYSGENDVVFGSVVSGRPENLHGSESMIGLFINTLPVRVKTSPQQRVLSWLKTLQVQQLEVREFGYSSLVDIQTWSELPQTHALFEQIVVFENYPADSEAFEQNLSLKIEALAAEERINYPLTLAVIPNQALDLYLVYDSKRFHASIAQRLILQVQHLLQEMMAQPMQRLGELTFLPEAEYKQIVTDWNNTTILFPGRETLPDLFEAQVACTPDAIALICREAHLTYHELNARANVLAHELQMCGVGPDVLVGLYCDRSADMIIGMFAVLKAGGAYVPLDPTYPQERLTLIIEDTQLAYIVTQKDFSAALKHHDCKLLYVDAACKNEQNPQRELDSEHIAYVIYTSGSTGTPKGAMMRHEGICSLVRTQVETLGIGPESRFAQGASLNFDASVWEIMSPLMVGAALYIDTREAMMPGPALLELLDMQATTIAEFTPSVLATLPDAELRSLGTLITAGEACASEQVARWSKGRRFHNAYGPTEATIYATIALDLAETATPTIGRSIANAQVYILDANLQVVSPGVAGELYIGGSGLARGYLKRPELTAERFVPDHLGAQAGKRLYKTGDLARYTLDGQIEFIGRNDHQLKIRGLRIEPGEIEMALSLHPAVQRCIVVGRKKEDAEHHLVAYVLPKEWGRGGTLRAPSDPTTPASQADSHGAHGRTQGAAPTPFQETQQGLPQSLRSFLQEKLPSYMLPDTFIVVNELPLTPNGKVDLLMLPTPDDEAQQQPAEELQEPRDMLEMQLLQAYEEVLQVHPIGITDDFFVLGGHSLTAVRLVSEIQKRLTVTVTLPMLFQAGTVAQLAVLLRRQQDTVAAQPAHSPLIALQKQGQRQPLFLVHPANGHVMCYYNLIRHLSADQPIYGLQDPDVEAQEITMRTVEELASIYLAAIREVQPEGPYMLGGYSFGCVVAFEMAQQLRKASQEVAFLALLDGDSPAVKEQILLQDANLLAIMLVEWLRGSIQKKTRELYQELSLLSPEKQLLYALQLLQEGKVDLLSAEPQWLGRQVQLFKYRLQAAQGYQTHSYDRQMTVFASSVADTPVHLTNSINSPDPLGWHHYATQPIDLYMLPGYHETLLREPYVQPLAVWLQECLDRAMGVGSRT